MKKRVLPAQDVLRALLHYKPDTGKLFWKERGPEWFANEAHGRTWNSRFAGREAFTADNGKGYRVGSILGEEHRAHRIIWKLVTGVDPDEIDHIDRDTSNNRWPNLRSVSHAENCRNMPRLSNSSSGHTGVHWDQRKMVWISHVGLKGRHKFLGYFDSLQAAVEARKVAEASLGFHQNHGSAGKIGR